MIDTVPSQPPERPETYDPERFDVPVAGGSLAVYRFGSDRGDRSSISRPCVIAAHGITGNGLAWIAVAQALNGRVSLVAPDLRGRARSNHLSEPFGMARHAEDMLAIADYLGVERPIVAGHSMGAYVAARFAADRPDRCAAAVLVDGGLQLPGSEGVDPDAFLDAFLGPAIARLSMSFPSREAYLDFWRAHPAFAGGDVDADLLRAYVEHDLIGEAPQLRSSVMERAVRADGAELIRAGGGADVAVPATLLHAPRGLLNEESPVVPPTYVEAWVSAQPNLRLAREIPDTNHYTIVMGSGAGAVGEAILSYASQL